MENPYLTHTGLPEETIRQYNNDLVHLFSLYLNLAPDAIDEQSVQGLADDCHITRDEAFAQYFAAIAGLDTAGKDRLFFRYWLQPAIKEMDSAPFLADDYFQNVHIKPQKRGKWELKTESLRPFEAFVRDDFVVTGDRRMIPQIGFFKEAYHFPAVLENGREWMTLLPNEMVTTWPALKKAHGRVLTFGLGLGYFTYHASENPDVDSVTVVDISPDVIELFKEQILPQFPHKEKVQLICADAFEFADTKMAGNFDFVFADIWHDAGDGKELYLKMKAYESKHPDIDFTFWLEDTIKCYLDECLW